MAFKDLKPNDPLARKRFKDRDPNDPPKFAKAADQRKTSRQQRRENDLIILREFRLQCNRILPVKESRYKKERRLVDAAIRCGFTRQRAVAMARNELKKSSPMSWPIKKTATQERPLPLDTRDGGFSNVTGVADPTDEEFSLKAADGNASTATVKVRTQQIKFRREVITRYGEQCAVCDIEVPELLNAAHICDKRNQGADDARNGLVLCVNHHAAFDALLFGIEPETLDIATRPNGPSLKMLGVKLDRLRVVRNKPADEALRWAWKRWKESF